MSADRDVERLGRGALDAVEDDRRGVGALLAAHQRRRRALRPDRPAARRRRRGRCRRRRAGPSSRRRSDAAASLPMVVVLPLPLTPMTSRTNGLRRPEVERGRRQRQHLGGAPAQERPDRVGILPARGVTASCESLPAASGWCARRCRRSAAPSRSRRRPTGSISFCAREDLAEAGDEPARARAREPGRERGSLFSRGAAEARRLGNGMTWAGARRRVRAGPGVRRRGSTASRARRGLALPRWARGRLAALLRRPAPARPLFVALLRLLLRLPPRARARPSVAPRRRGAGLAGRSICAAGAGAGAADDHDAEDAGARRRRRRLPSSSYSSVGVYGGAVGSMAGGTLSSNVGAHRREPASSRQALRRQIMCVICLRSAIARLFTACAWGCYKRGPQ